MEFMPVNELERLLVAAASDFAARPAFYRGITEHPLFVINEGSAPGREGKTVLRVYPKSRKSVNLLLCLSLA